MADKFLGNIISGNHVAPKPSMPLVQKLLVATAVLVVVSLGSFLMWKFINYREESRVRQFLEELTSGRYDQAFALWDSEGTYQMKEFLEDFGKDGFYTKGVQEARVVTSTGQGGAVIVCVELDPKRKYLPVLVNKDSLKLSYSPVDKCN